MSAAVERCQGGAASEACTRGWLPAMSSPLPPLQPPLTSSVSCLTSTNCCPGALNARSCRERYSRSSFTRWALNEGGGEGGQGDEGLLGSSVLPAGRGTNAPAWIKEGGGREMLG